MKNCANFNNFIKSIFNSLLKNYILFQKNNQNNNKFKINNSNKHF